MNSFLDQELENLKQLQQNQDDFLRNSQLNQISSLPMDKNSNQFVNSNLKIQQQQNLKNIEFGSNERENIKVKQNNFIENENLKIQNDLMNLQEKLANLQNKISELPSNNETQNQIRNIKENQVTLGNNNFVGSQNDYFNQNKKQSRIEEDNTPLRLNQKYFESSTFSSNKKLHQQKNLLSSQENYISQELKNHQEHPQSAIDKIKIEAEMDQLYDEKYKTYIQLSNNKKKQKCSKLQLEKAIKLAEDKLNQSRISNNRSGSHSKQRTSRIKKTANTNITKKNIEKRSNSQQILKQNLKKEKEIDILNKKINDVQKQRKQYTDQILKEKLQNQQYQLEIDRLQKILNKVNGEKNKNKNITQEYNKLLDSFEKSEFIRKQQKKLIENLKDELEFVQKQYNDWVSLQEKKIKKVQSRKTQSKKNNNIINNNNTVEINQKKKK